MSASNTDAGPLAASVTVTQAVAQAMGAGEGVTCQLSGEHVSKHVARGIVVVGSSTYTLKGICYDHATNYMELVSERPGELSSMTGALASAAPREFSGRLVVTGPSPSRYSFALRNLDGGATPETPE